jgi:hypothetical protein
LGLVVKKYFPILYGEATLHRGFDCWCGGNVAEAGHLENICERKLASFAALRQSILRKAFAGELTANAEKALPEAAE